MFNKLNKLSVDAYMAVTGFFKGLKNDERGLSGVVVAVLLILVAVLAVVAIWGFLNGWLGELWTKITGADDGMGSLPSGY